MTGIAPVTAESAAVSANTHLLGGDEFPLRYDLRDYGVVTPVRYQNPWSTCWSFGGIAAAEDDVQDAASAID